MRILSIKGLRRRYVALTAHVVSTAYEMGWAELDNGALLAAAERDFEALVTTDRNLRYQQNLSGRQLAILILPTNSWPKIQAHHQVVVAAVNGLGRGDVVELSFS